VTGWGSPVIRTAWGGLFTGTMVSESNPHMVGHSAYCEGVGWSPWPKVRLCTNEKWALSNAFSRNRRLAHCQTS
jgi:hypothetical protein